MPTALSHEHAVAERLESGLPEQRRLGSPVSLAVQIPTLQADPKALHVRSPALGLLQATRLQFGPPLWSSCTQRFVLLCRQKDAAIAAQANLHPEDGHSFRVFECPGPEEVPD